MTARFDALADALAAAIIEEQPDAGRRERVLMVRLGLLRLAASQGVPHPMAAWWSGMLCEMVEQRLP